MADISFFERLIPVITPNSSFLNSGGQLRNASGWAIVEGAGKTLSADSNQFYSGDSSLSINGVSGTCAFGAKAVKVTPGQRYKIKFAFRSSIVTGSGLYVRMNERTAYPTGDFITSANRTSTTDFISNSSIASANTWILREFIYTVPTSVYWVSPSVYSWTGLGTAQLWFDWLEMSANVPTDITTTTETLAGYTRGGLPVYVRRVAGTSPVLGGDFALITPSTGTASRLLGYVGFITRSGGTQRHPINTVTPDSGLAHASMIYQAIVGGTIRIYGNNTAFASQAYDVDIYYTK